MLVRSYADHPANWEAHDFELAQNVGVQNFGDEMVDFGSQSNALYVTYGTVFLQFYIKAAPRNIASLISLTTSCLSCLPTRITPRPLLPILPVRPRRWMKSIVV